MDSFHRLVDQQQHPHVARLTGGLYPGIGELGGVRYEWSNEPSLDWPTQATNPLRHPHVPPKPGQLPPTGKIELPWIERKRPNRQRRTPWQDPRILNIIQRATAPAYANNGGSNTASAANSVAASFGSNVTVGNCIVAFVDTPTGITVSTVTDTLGQQWTIGTAGNNASGSRVTPCYCLFSLGGANTVTANLSGTASSAVIEIGEYTNVGSVASNRGADTASGASGNGTAVTITSGPNNSNSLIISGVGDLVGGITYTAGGSITRRQSVTSPVGLALGEQIGSSTAVANIASAWTASGTVQWAEAVLVLRPAATQPAVRRSGGNVVSGTSWTFTVTAVVGDFMVMALQTANNTTTVSTVTDTASTVWTKVTSIANASGGELSVWWAAALTGSSTTITVTGNGGTSTLGHATTSLLGILPSASPIDVTATATGNGTAVSVGPSTATALANETALLIVGTPASFGTTSTNGGSTTLHQNNGNASGSTLVESLLLNATGAQTLTATLATSQQWCAALITIKTGGVVFMQSSAGASSGTPSALLNFNTTTGNTIVILASVNNQTGLTGISSPTATQAITKNNASGGSTDIWYVANIAGGKATNTAALSGNVAKAIISYEFAGLDTSAPLDVKTSSTGNSQSATTGTTGTPNYLLELVIAAAGDAGTGRAYTATAPGVIVHADQTATIVLSGQMYMAFQPGIVPVGQSATFAIPGGANVQWASAIVTLKAATTGAYYNRIAPETLSMAETWSRPSVLGRIVADTLAMAETWSRQSNFGRIVADALSLAETWKRQTTSSRIVSETLAMAETWKRQTTSSRIYTETLAMAETWKRQTTFGRVVSDALHLAETWLVGLISSRRSSVTATAHDRVTVTITGNERVDVDIESGDA